MDVRCICWVHRESSWSAHILVCVEQGMEMRKATIALKSIRKSTESEMTFKDDARTMISRRKR